MNTKNLNFGILCWTFIFYTQASEGQISHSSQWSWRNGQTSNSMVRGPKGAASIDFNPGYREGAAQFKDPNGNLWIYGGSFNGSTYSDLWFFNISTDEWTWVSGTSGINAEPVFGTFRNGDFSTFPGARYESYNWFDPQNGKLWLYGGIAYGSGVGVGWRSDLWSFNLQSGIWTWMSGSTQMNQTAFGSSFSSPTNTPGARNLGVSWFVNNLLDPAQAFISTPLPPRPCSKLYLAFGFLAGGGRTQDIWVYNTDDNNWMVIGSPVTVTNGVQSAPFRREGSASWVRSEIMGTTSQVREFLYCYGGYGADRTGIEGYLEDLWKFDVMDGKWYYVSGDFYINPLANQSRPGANWKRKADISHDESKVYLFGLQNNDVWEYNYGNAQWNKYSQGGTVNHGILKGQSLQVRPYSGFDANLWFGKNRLYTFGGGNTFCYFDPCNSNSITASQSSVNDLADNVTFTCNTNSSISITYQWRKNNAVIPQGNSPTFTTSGIMPTDVFSCFVTATAGCASDIKLLSYSNNIAIACTPPINDDPCNAISLTLDVAPEYGNNAYATSVNDLPVSCFKATNTVWFRYSPPVSGFVQFTLGAGLFGDTLNSWISAFVSSANNCPSSITIGDSTLTTLGGCRAYYSPGNKNPTIWSSFLTQGKTYYFRLSSIFGDVGKYSFSIQSTNFTNIAAGNWHDPTIWFNNKVPGALSNVAISFPVTVNADAICTSLSVQNGAQVVVQSNVNLTILNPSNVNQSAASLKFDGVNDYISIPHNNLLKPSNGITIEAWINPTNIHSSFYSEIYRKEDGNARHLLSFQNNGTILSFGLGIAGVYSELDVPILVSDYEGQWVHTAATFDGVTRKIYRNNLLIGSQNITGLINTFGTAPSIIGSSSGTSEFFNGSIDEFRLWDHAIQVEKKLNCEISNPETGLLIYYKFNQGINGGGNAAVNKVFDSSGNLIDGSLLNFSLINVNSNWVFPGGVQTGSNCAN